MNLNIDTPEWAEPFLQPARYKGAYGGRGSGKSHERAEALIEAHILNPDTASVCLREVQKSIKMSVKRLLEIKIESMGVGHEFDIMESMIRNKRGKGIIVFQGMQNHTADSIKSLEGFDIAWFEEAQTASQRSLDLLRPTIRKPGSELWFTWNPDEETDPIDQLLRGDNPPPDGVVLEVNYTDNPHFPDVLQKEMEYDRGRDKDKYEHIWLGKYKRRSASRVFNNWTVEEFEAPADAEFRLGADWGFATDPTVAIRTHIIGKKLYLDYEAYRVNCEITDTPDLLMTIPEAESWPMVADSARPETISHVRNNGFRKILSAVKGPNSLDEGVEWLKTYDIIVHPRCVHAIDELSTYSYKVDPLTDVVLSELEDKNNHVIDAIRYACEAVRRKTKQKPKYEAPKPTANHWN